MQCLKCGTDNPVHNNFCGHCGSVLVRQTLSIFDDTEPEMAGENPVPEPQRQPQRNVAIMAPPAPEPEPEPEPELEETTISGPSFLGLTGDSPNDVGEYLLVEDNPGHASRWMAFSLIALVLLGGTGYMGWRAVKTGNFSYTLPKFLGGSTIGSTAAQPSAASPSTPAPNAGNTAATNMTNTAAAQDSGPPAMGPLQEDEQKLQAAQANQPTPGAEDAAKQTDETNQPAPDASSAKATTSKAGKDQPKEEMDDSARFSKPTPPKAAARDVSLTKTEDPRENKMLLQGEKYLYGRGVTRNCQQAVVYFHAAAEDYNNVPAMSHLGALYETGECVPQNRMTAYSWFSRAHDADPKNPWIQKNMSMLWRDMTQRERAAVSK